MQNKNILFLVAVGAIILYARERKAITETYIQVQQDAQNAALLAGASSWTTAIGTAATAAGTMYLARAANRG